MSSSNNARITLSIDTKQAQQDVKIVDEELNGLGKNAGIDLGIDSKDFKEFIDLQKKFISSFSSYATTTSTNTQKILAKLEEVNNSVAKTLRQDAEDEYEKKLRELENKKRMMETNLKPSSGGGGSSSGGSSGGGGEDLKSSISSLIGKFALASAAIGGLRGGYNYMSQGAQSARSKESQAFSAYNKFGMFGSDFNAGRKYAGELGSTYGSSASDVMNLQQSYTGKSGFTTKSDLSIDTESILRLSKAHGMDSGAVGATMGGLVQTGASTSGNQRAMADMLAQSIETAGMTGRESEQLDVLNSINDNLGNNTTNVTSSAIANNLGLYSMLASGNPALKGQRGGDMVSNMNNAIANGGNKLDVMLGWGTKYTGAEGLVELKKLKEKGTSDPTVLKDIFEGFESRTGLNAHSDEGKLALEENLGISITQVEELLKHEKEILAGNYKVASEGGKTGELMENYDESKVSTQEKYEVEKENAKDSVGNALNNVTSPLKDAFNSIPGWAQSGIGLAGAAGAGALGGRAFQTGTLGNLMKGGKSFMSSFKKGSVPDNFAEYADDIVDVMNSGGNADGLLKGLSKSGNVTDDMLNWVDELTDTYNQGGAIDDVLKQGFKKFGKSFKGNMGKVVGESAEALGGVDDVLNAGASSMDDVAATVTKSAGKFSKTAGKALGVIGTGLQLANGAYEFMNADSNEERGAAVGGTAGGMGGGWAGAAGGAALGTAIFPGAGTLLGGILGGIGGSLAGDAAGSGLGSWLGSMVPEATDDASLPSHYGMPKLLDGYLSDGDIKWNNEMAPELLTWKNSQEYANFKSGSKRVSGSNAIGNDYIPYDGYISELHKGEAVLSANEAQQYRQGKTQGSSTLLDKQTRAMGDITDTNYRSIERYAGLLETEAGLLAKREILFNNQNSGDSITAEELVGKSVRKQAVNNDNRLWNSTQLNPNYGLQTVNSPNVSNSGNSSKLDINVTGNIDGMNPDNQDAIVEQITKNIQYNSNSSTYALLNNSYMRTQH